MYKVALYSCLLILGVIFSELLPSYTGQWYPFVVHSIHTLTLLCLAYIMINVGYEFIIEKDRLKSYGKDYLIAMTSAALPWIFCAVYLYCCAPHLPIEPATLKWKEALFAGRFASPTSAGILFSMLAAAGLRESWVYKKARTLAIFDDLDTILIIIPLKIAVIGIYWHAGLVVGILVTLLVIAWRYLHQFNLPTNWPWILLYAVILTTLTESLRLLPRHGADFSPTEMGVLLPAFVLGCVTSESAITFCRLKDKKQEYRNRVVRFYISCAFMCLVGLSLPPLFCAFLNETRTCHPDLTSLLNHPMMTLDNIPPGIIAFHAFIVLCLANLGKMFPLLCYRKEVPVRERLALSISMFARGEVSAGIIFISLVIGISPPILAIVVSALAMNLVLTGFFIIGMRLLLGRSYTREIIAPPK